MLLHHLKELNHQHKNKVNEFVGDSSEPGVFTPKKKNKPGTC